MRRLAQQYQAQLAAAEQEIQRAKETQAEAAQAEVDVLREQLAEVREVVQQRAAAEAAAARAEAHAQAAQQRAGLEAQLTAAQAQAAEGQQRAGAAEAAAAQARQAAEAADAELAARRAELAAQQETASAAQLRFELLKKNYEVNYRNDGWEWVGVRASGERGLRGSAASHASAGMQAVQRCLASCAPLTSPPAAWVKLLLQLEKLISYDGCCAASKAQGQPLRGSWPRSQCVLGPPPPPANAPHPPPPRPAACPACPVQALMRQYAPGLGAGVFLERAVSRKAAGEPQSAGCLVAAGGRPCPAQCLATVARQRAAPVPALLTSCCLPCLPSPV